ncbi:MAG: type II toxin-antitoxin system HicA family toxin [Chloroflexota bacterium]
MPPRLCELTAELRRAGFIEFVRQGKGSHTRWQHPTHADLFVSLAGHDGDDAKAYLVHDVRDAIRTARQRDEQERS